MTVHTSKGIEFDVVFVVGMADGVFSDNRAIIKNYFPVHHGGALAET